MITTLVYEKGDLIENFTLLLIAILLKVYFEKVRRF